MCSHWPPHFPKPYGCLMACGSTGLCWFLPVLYKLYKQCKICPQTLHGFLSPYPTHGPVHFVSPSALSGPRPEMRRGSGLGHLPQCSRGARTTRGEPGPGAGTGSAGRLPGWCHRTVGPRERVVSHGAGHVCNQHVSPGWGKATPVVSPSHNRYTDLRPREEHSLPSK